MERHVFLTKVFTVRTLLQTVNIRFEYWPINQTFARIWDCLSVSGPSFITYYFSRKSISCLVKLWSCGVQGRDSESLWHVLWFLHLLFFILSSHVIFIVAASMQPFAVNLCWWILSSVLFFSLRPTLWSSLWRPPLCLRPGHHPRGLCRSSVQPSSSSVSFWGGDGALSDAGVPQVTAVVAADGPGQAWVMLWGSQIISTWSRNEPRLQLDSYGLDGWQKSLSSSRCMVAPPSGRGLSCSLYLWPIKAQQLM